MMDDPPQTLRRIEQRLTQASQAAERLIAEAERRRPPAAGWQPPVQDDPGHRTPELELLHAAARLLDELVPAEAVARLAAALRELLLAVRAVLDYYVERLGRSETDPEDAVKDIPID